MGVLSLIGKVNVHGLPAVSLLSTWMDRYLDLISSAGNHNHTHNHIHAHKDLKVSSSFRSEDSSWIIYILMSGWLRIDIT